MFAETRPRPPRVKLALRIDMDDGLPPPATNDSTQLGEEEAERSIAFQFISEDGMRRHSRSSALSTIRSQARRHANSERRRRNTPSVGRRQLLQRARDPGPSLPELGSDDMSADVNLYRREDVAVYQSSTFWVDEEPHAESSGQTDSQRNIYLKRSASRHMVLTEKQVVPKTSMKSNSDHTARVRQYQEKILRTYLEFFRQQPTPVQTILGAGRIDPLQTYPFDLDLYEHRLVDHFIAVGGQAFPKQIPWLAKWVPFLMQDKMTLKSMLLAGETHLRATLGHGPWSPRASQLTIETCALLNEELGKPNLIVTDVMVATVIQLSGIELVFGGQRSKYKSHMSGLRQMIKSRGGLDNFGLDGLMKDLIIWVHQAGGEFLVPSAQDAIQGHEHILGREQEDGSREIIANNLPRPSSISNEMVQILRSIRFISTAQKKTRDTAPPSKDFQAACLGVQQQLENLRLKTDPMSIEGSCILSALIYVDKMLLKSLVKREFISDAGIQLQHTIMLSRSVQELEDNKEVLDWISTTAPVVHFFDDSPSQRANLANKFNALVTRLDELHIA